MAPTKVRRSVKKRDGGGKSSQRLLAEASPESKCPICLDGFNNVASLDRCLHQFCFRCIHEWSKNKAECPLCKQPFHSIIHSVKGENDFKEFVLRPVENGAGPNAAAGDPSDRVLRPRVLRGRERRSRRAQQPVPSSSSPPLEDDVMFEGLSDAVSLAENQDVQQMVLRLTVHRRGRGEGRSLRRLRDQDVVAFRRALYRTGVRVRNSRDAGRQRNISAAYLRQNPACLRRLLPWLQRELTVLYGSHGSLVNIVQHIIMSRITNYNMEDSAIRDELRPFLLARTDHFLHELVSFARSTLSMEAYDQQAIYDCPAPSYEEGSSSDSSVIAISEDDDDDNDSEEDVTENPSVVPEHLPSVPSASGESLLSQSAWDDETPGPSYSTLLPSSSQSQGEGEEPSSSTAPPLKNLESDAVGSVSTGPADDEEEEECLIVGYVKPMAERTPELVHLSSDSSEEEQEAVTTETADTVTKTETSSVQLPSSPQAHERLPSPALPPSLAPSLSPQHTHSDSQSCTPSDRGRHAHQHRSRDRSRSRLRRSRERSGFKGHRNRRERTHRRSGSKERPERLRNTKSQDQVCTRSPSQTHSRQSPAVSICSGSPRSDCSKRSPSRNESSSDTSRERDRYSHSLSLQERERGTGRARERTSGSPDSDSLLHSHRPRSRSRESQRGRKRRQRPMSSSSSTERSRLDKPSGKRKYKTRHLERAAHRQHGEGTAATLKRSGHGRKERRREQPPSRSPSVEIIYERQAPSSHTHSLQRKKRRHRKRRREQRSPTVITIDSDSDRTIDCLDRVIDVTDQTAADSDHEQRNRTPEQDELLNDSNLSNTCNLPSSNALLEPSSPLDPSTVSSDRSVNTEHCVDTNSHGLNTDTRESVPGFLPDVSVTTTPPSDTRLLESILQELKEFLPGVEQEAGQGVGPNPENPITSSFIQQENTASPQRDQSDMRGHTDTLNNKNTDSDTQQETQTDTVN